MQETFVRRFLTKSGWTRGDIKVDPYAAGRGAAEAHVRKRFPALLKQYRTRRNRAETRLVVVAVPTWNIETWLAYLRGESVDESRDDYPRLDKSESGCQPQVEALAEMCRRRELREPPPPSLTAACREVRARLR